LLDGSKEGLRAFFALARWGMEAFLGRGLGLGSLWGVDFSALLDGLHFGYLLMGLISLLVVVLLSNHLHSFVDFSLRFDLAHNFISAI